MKVEGLGQEQFSVDGARQSGSEAKNRNHKPEIAAKLLSTNEDLLLFYYRPEDRSATGGAEAAAAAFVAASVAATVGTVAAATHSANDAGGDDAVPRTIGLKIPESRLNKMDLNELIEVRENPHS